MAFNYLMMDYVDFAFILDNLDNEYDRSPKSYLVKSEKWLYIN